MDTALYLLPVTLGDTPVETVLPAYNKEIILQIRHFIVEDVRSARRFLKKVYAEHQTQLFIETPYRNNKMVEDILHNCRPQTKLCIAANITCEGEYIRTRTVSEWRGKVPDLSKIPCIFLLYK